MRIGVFDSGMGGLSVLNGIINVFSDAEYIYIADNEFAPYGTKTDDELINRGLKIVQYFESQNVELVIIACNTMSVYLDILQSKSKVKILGVIKPTVDYITTLGIKEVALIATFNTIRNKTYQNLLLERNIETDALECSFLVEIVEDKVKANTQELFKTKISNNHFESLSYLILGCTHFNLLKKEIKDVLPHINLIDTTIGVICALEKMGYHKKNMINQNKLRIMSTLNIDLLDSLIKKYQLFDNNRYEVELLKL